jgi:hypothetical protein
VSETVERKRTLKTGFEGEQSHEAIFEILSDCPFGFDPCAKNEAWFNKISKSVEL